MKLMVWAQVENSFETVGYIETFPGSGGEFTYASSWLDRQDTAPISFSLPLRTEPFKLNQMQPYFEGLLPEEGMRVGSARKIDDVSLQSFEELAEESHIAPQLVKRDVSELCEQVREVLDSSSDGTKIVDACVEQCKKRLDQLIAS